MARVTLTEMGTPSRSKGRGWARVEQQGESIFATPTGRAIDVDSDTISVIVGVELRRPSGTQTDRRVVTLTVTGSDDDAVDISLGSPQSYDVRVSGVRAETP